MSYLTKFVIYFLCLIAFHLGSAQDQTEESLDSSEKKNVVFFSVGAFHPMAFGDNLANKALDKKIGINYAMMFRIPDSQFRLGFYLSGFKATIKPDAVPKVGNYSKTGIFSVGVQVGYIFWEHSNWVAYVDGGFGYTRYGNSGENFDFKDDGYSTALTPSLQYDFHKSIGVYTGIAYRHDFLKTKAPSTIRNFFKHQNYVMLNLGVVFSF
ncbi:MAG TPA: hypothetical protein VK021_11205 [Flavobacteriaceae bacterium]|nr:hypothetical protein [Flavobacteriaceae bacterium]